MIESTLEQMITIFDVEPLDPALTRFAGDSDGGAGRWSTAARFLPSHS